MRREISELTRGFIAKYCQFYWQQVTIIVGIGLKSSFKYITGKKVLVKRPIVLSMFSPISCHSFSCTRTLIGSYIFIPSSVTDLPINLLLWSSSVHFMERDPSGLKARDNKLQIYLTKMLILPTFFLSFKVPSSTLKIVMVRVPLECNFSFSRLLSGFFCLSLLMCWVGMKYEDRSVILTLPVFAVTFVRR